MPKNCKPNRSLKHAEAWSHEELQRRRELKVEKLKRKHISQEKEANDNADGGKDVNATNNDNNVPFSLKRQMLLAHDTEDKKDKGMYITLCMSMYLYIMCLFTLIYASLPLPFR